MRTVGEILKKARQEKNLTLDEIEKSLRIRKKFLMALEENAWICSLRCLISKVF